jgi:hypothetical protein
MRQFRRPAVAVLVLLHLWPSLVFGQATKAGVISTLQGTVTASRTTVPQPVPLKFKDDVFLQDRIATGDQSIARILLGGKALVTVRERSVLTITEIPGRSTVNLENGKIGLAVARERMAPGESVDIRTSNAIAAVRGTVVVAEVSRTIAQAAPGAAPQIVTNIYVLRDATNRGVVITQLATGTSSTLLPGQGFSILGATAGRNVPIPPNVSAGLSASAGAQHTGGSAEGTSNVATTQTQQAVVLTNAVLGDPTIITTPATEGGLVAETTGTVTEPEVSTATIGVNETQVTETVVAPPPPAPPAPLLPDITGNFNCPSDPRCAGGGVVAVASGDSVIIPGQLVVIHDAQINLTAPFAVVAGNVTSEEPDNRAFVVIDPTTINSSAGLLVLLSPGSLTLSGPLLAAAGTSTLATNFFLGDDVIRICADTVAVLCSGATGSVATGFNATLSSTTTLPLITATNNVVLTTPGHFVLLRGDVPNGPGRAVMELHGPLLSASDSSITVATDNASAFLQLTQGADVTGHGGATFVQLSSTFLQVGDPFALGAPLGFLAIGPQDSVSVGGGLLSMAAGSEVEIFNSPVVRQNGGTFSSGGDVVTLTGNSSLTAGQIVSVFGAGTMTVGGRILAASDSDVTTNGTAISISGGSTVTLGDSAVALVNSSLTVNAGTVVGVNGATLNGNSTAPLIIADPSSITAPGLVSIGALGAISLAGPVADATDVTFNITGDFISIVNGTLSSTTALPAVTLLRSDLALSGEFLLNAGGTVTLQGGLLSARASDLSSTGQFIRQTGGTFTSAGAELVKLSEGSTLTTGGTFLTQTGGTFTSSGVLLVVDGTLGASSATINGTDGVLVTGGTLNVAGAYKVLNGTLTFNTVGASAITVDNATLNATSAITPLVSLSSSTLTLPGELLDVRNGGTATLAAQALQATSSTLNFSGGATQIIHVGGAGTQLITTGAVPVIDLIGGSLSLGNENAFLIDGGATATIAGTLFSANQTALSGIAAVVSVQNGTLNANGPSVFSLTDVSSSIINPLPQALDVGLAGTVNSAGPVAIATTSTLVFTGNPVIRVTGCGSPPCAAGILNAAGLLSQNVGSTTASGDLVGLFAAGTVNVTGGQPAISITDGSLTVAGSLLAGDNTGNVFNLTGSAVVGSNAIIDVGTLAALGNNDIFNATGNVPLLVLDNTNLTVNTAGEAAIGVEPAVLTSFAGQAAVITGGTVTLNDVFLSLGNVNAITVDPFVVVDGVVITSNNPAAAFIVLNDGTTLAGPVLQVTDSIITGFAHLLETTGTVNSNGTGTFITIDPSAITTASDTLSILGTLNLNGQLFSSTSSTISAAGDFLRVRAGGALLDVSAAVSAVPLLGFTGGTLTTTAASGNIVQVSGNPAGVSTLTLQRPLFTESGTLVSAFGNFLRIADGGSVASTAATPFVQFSGGSYVGGTGGPGTGGAILRMFSLAGENPSSFTLQDGYLQATNGATFSAPNAVFVDIRDSAQLTSTGATPFLDFSGGSSASAGFNFFAIGPNSTAGGNPGTDVSPTASFNGPLFRAADAGTPITFSAGNTNSFLSIFDGAIVTKTGASPAIQLIGSVPDGVVLSAAGNIVSVGTTGAVPPETPPTLTLAGSLIDAQNARIQSGNTGLVRSIVFIGDGSTVTKTDSAAFINLDTTNLLPTADVVSVRRSPSLAQRTTLDLGTAPLLVATNSPISTVNAGGFGGGTCCSGFFIGQGGRLLGTGASALIQLTNSPFTAGTSGVGGGNFFQVDDVCTGCATTDTFHLDSPGLTALVDVDAPLLSATDSPITALFHGIFVRRSILRSDSTNPLVTLTTTADTTFSFGGLDPAPPNNELFGSFLLVTQATGGSNAIARVDLAGSLLAMNDTAGLSRRTFNTTGDFVSVFNGASFVSTATSPVIISSDSTYNIGGATPFRRFFNVQGLGGAAGTNPAAAQVDAPLLTSLRDTFDVSGSFLRVANGASPNIVTFTHNNPLDAGTFMQFSGSVMTLGDATTPGAGNVVEVNTDTGIRYRGTGTFLLADTTGVAAWTADRLLFSQTATPGADPARGLNSSSTNPLFSFTGTPVGTHTFSNSLFDLKGFNTVIEGDPDASGLTVGSDQPLRHAGDLFRGSATPIQVGNAGGGNAIKLDTALFAATAPLMNLTAGSTATTPSDFLKLIQNAKLTGNLLPADALIKLDASTLNILNGVLANVAGGSFMNLTNTTLLSLINGSTANISGSLNNFDAGALIRVAGGSVFKMTGGSLISFGAGTNTATFTNPSNIVNCGVGCSLQNVNFNGTLAPVLLKNNAVIGNLTVAPGFNAFPGIGGSNTLNFALGTSALVIMDGAASKVVLRP